MSTVVTGLYDQDFYAWAMKNAELIRQGRFAETDLEHITEELESMGRSEWYELVDRLAVLLAHLLKWRYQPERRGNSGRLTIKEQRRRVGLRLKKSPSLKHEIDETLAEAYETAALKAAKEMKVDESRFPPACPFSLEQVLDRDYWPD
ncbi:MAG TPA: DUF29 domain-containing protein [Candidatus Competibacteraceae bacterium]|nr:DUF29 domain-containing protein [Gammaproteobacteria bacterium]HPF58810.1 DUF29 domain-containing protein [Candidatus Competibacteraceae bacterium]